MGFSKIEVITAMNKVQDLQTALRKVGVSGITVTQVIGCGVEKGTLEFEVEENKVMELLPKQMIMILIEDERVDEIVELIKKELYTGHIGDGKIIISPVTNIIRVRTGEEGEDALK